MRRTRAWGRLDAVAAVGLAGLAVVVLVVGIQVASSGPTKALRLGQRSFSLDLARDVLGPDVRVDLVDRHDGEWFWNLARDPLLRDTDALADRLDRPGYRARRIGYPLFAAPWRAGGEMALVWGLIATNLVVVALGTRIMVRLVRDLRCRPLTVLAFPLSPVVLISVTGDLGDALAVVGILGVLLAARRGRHGWALAAGVVAVLSKEVMLLGIIGLALAGQGLSLRRRLELVGVPVAVLGGWTAYVDMRLGGYRSGSEELQLIPFADVSRVLRDHLLQGGSPANGFVCLMIVLSSLAIITAYARQRSVELAVALPFAAMVPFLTPQVLALPVNSLRAVGPMFVLGVLAWQRGRAGAGIDDDVHPPRILDHDAAPAGRNDP